MRGLVALAVVGLLVTACSGGAGVESSADAVAVETDDPVAVWLFIAGAV